MVMLKIGKRRDCRGVGEDDGPDYDAPGVDVAASFLDVGAEFIAAHVIATRQQATAAALVADAQQLGFRLMMVSRGSSNPMVRQFLDGYAAAAKKLREGQCLLDDATAVAARFTEAVGIRLPAPPAVPPASGPVPGSAKIDIDLPDDVREPAPSASATTALDDNTMFLRAILRQDWASYEESMDKLARQGKGTPVAIIGSAFHLAVKRRFEPERDVEEIVKFVAEARTFFGESEDLPPREAEALVRANLNLEASWVEEIVDRLDVLVIAEIEGQLLCKLILDEDLSDEQLDEFLTEAERFLQEWQEQV